MQTSLETRGNTCNTKKLNGNLHKAKREKNDEFYTQLTDIEKEMRHYWPHFAGKTVFLNCDDPEHSNFWMYFQLKFDVLKIKRLVSTHYDQTGKSYKLEIVGDSNGDGVITSKDIIKTPLMQNGDFRSPECVDLLDQADIVVTNPPFSLFREFIHLLVRHDKKFIVLGNMNSITAKDIFPLIKDGKVWLGANNGGNKWFKVPDHYEMPTETRRRVVDGQQMFSLSTTCWYTNLDFKKRHDSLDLRGNTFNPAKYPTYDNYDAIEVSKVADIPEDYYGVMGVPITFLDKWNPEQFEVLGMDDHRLQYPAWRGRGPDLNGKCVYRRVIIKRKPQA